MRKFYKCDTKLRIYQPLLSPENCKRGSKGASYWYKERSVPRKRLVESQSAKYNLTSLIKSYMVDYQKARKVIQKIKPINIINVNRDDFEELKEKLMKAHSQYADEMDFGCEVMMNEFDDIESDNRKSLRNGRIEADYKRRLIIEDYEEEGYEAFEDEKVEGKNESQKESANPSSMKNQNDKGKASESKELLQEKERELKAEKENKVMPDKIEENTEKKDKPLSNVIREKPREQKEKDDEMRKKDPLKNKDITEKDKKDEDEDKVKKEKEKAKKKKKDKSKEKGTGEDKDEKEGKDKDKEKDKEIKKKEKKAKKERKKKEKELKKEMKKKKNKKSFSSSSSSSKSKEEEPKELFQTPNDLNDYKQIEKRVISSAKERQNKEIQQKQKQQDEEQIKLIQSSYRKHKSTKLPQNNNKVYIGFDLPKKNLIKIYFNTTIESTDYNDQVASLFVQIYSIDNMTTYNEVVTIADLKKLNIISGSRVDKQLISSQRETIAKKLFTLYEKKLESELKESIKKFTLVNANENSHSLQIEEEKNAQDMNQYDNGNNSKSSCNDGKVYSLHSDKSKKSGDVMENNNRFEESKEEKITYNSLVSSQTISEQ